MKPTALLLIFACSALAGEYAVLASGAHLYAERHESDGGKVTLFTQTGSTEMDASQVVRFEQEDYAPPQDERASAPAAAPPKPNSSVQHRSLGRDQLLLILRCENLRESAGLT